MPRTLGRKEHACEACPRRFSRADHLKRHTATHHSGGQQFVCNQCSRSFQRQDVLDRHRHIHLRGGETLVQTKGRACHACVNARTKCTGVAPCPRCVRRSLECTLPVPKAKNTQHASGSLQDDTSTPSRVPEDADEIQLDSAPTSGARPVPLAAAAPLVDDGTHDLQRYYSGHQPQQQYRQPSGNLAYPPESLVEPSSNPYAQGSNQTQTSYENLQIPTQPLASTFLGHQSLMPRDYSQLGVLMPDRPWTHYDIGTLNWLDDIDGAAEGGLELPPDLTSRNIMTQNFASSEMATPADLLSHGSTSQSPWAARHASAAVGDSTSIDPGTVGSTCEDDSASPNESATFYSDGKVTREAKGTLRTPGRGHPEATRAITSFALAKPPTIENLPRREAIEFDASAYISLQQAFQLTCYGASAMFRTFASDQFPSIGFLQRLIWLYFKHFHPFMPVLHVSLLQSTETPWPLVLAVAAIGAHYLDGDHTHAFGVSMHEFTRRVLFAILEDASALPEFADFARTHVLTLILHVIGTTYCGDQRLQKLGFVYHSEMTQFCEQKWKQTASTDHVANIPQDPAERHTAWLRWRDDELHIRSGYCIWLIDAMWAIHYQRKPVLSLDSAMAALPCHEILWETDSADEWARLAPNFRASRSLCATIRDLYIEKQLSPEIGEFSRILLIHGLFRRSWEVENYFGQGLSGWVPSARRESTLDDQKIALSVWLPSVPDFVKWRNSTCDCLDVLHWSANAAIGNAGGMEHPTVLHLHFARIVLLTPMRAIIRLAQRAVDGRKDQTLQQQGEFNMRHDDDQLIAKWVTQDQYKARLSMIHAGVLFWHVRRFSQNAFYEPGSLAIATLALWAFLKFRRSAGHSTAVRPTDNTTTLTTTAPTNQAVADLLRKPNSSAATGLDGDSAPDTILLDRPTDDELVQEFVRRGDGLVVKMTGISDLYSSRGSQHVLESGRRLLLTLNGWACTRSWIEKIDTLISMDASSNETPTATVAGADEV